MFSLFIKENVFLSSDNEYIVFVVSERYRSGVHEFKQTYWASKMIDSTSYGRPFPLIVEGYSDFNLHRCCSKDTALIYQLTPGASFNLGIKYRESLNIFSKASQNKVTISKIRSNWISGNKVKTKISAFRIRGVLCKCPVDPSEYFDLSDNVYFLKELKIMNASENENQSFFKYFPFTRIEDFNIILGP